MGGSEEDEGEIMMRMTQPLLSRAIQVKTDEELCLAVKGVKRRVKRQPHGTAKRMPAYVLSLP